jgi:4-coumarate--CoA ligase (photoactive yellow protein activation family)
MTPNLSRDTILRIIADLILETLAQVGRTFSGEVPRGVPEIAEDTPLSEGVLGLDSVGVLSAAGRINSFFHLYETGTEDSLLRAKTVGQWVDQVQAALRDAVAAVCFRTSGSTGVPKEVHHRLEWLQQEAEYLGRLFADRKRVISLVSPKHIYGFLLSGMLPDTLGVPVLDGRRFNARTWTKELQSDDLVIGYPEYWRFVERSVPAVTDGVIGVSSTAPTPASLIRALQAKGFDRIVEIYGSTETAGVGYRDSPDQPFVLFPFWERAAESEGSDLRRLDANGEGRELAEVMDELEWVGDRAFRPLRRRDDAVQVGGTNVFPALIERRLIALPYIADAHVRLMRPSEGSRLKALVVPNVAEPVHEVEQRLTAWIETNLSPPERPTAITLVREIPTDSMGKRADWDVSMRGDWR